MEKIEKLKKILIREKFLFGKPGETTYIISENGSKK